MKMKASKLAVFARNLALSAIFALVTACSSAGGPPVQVGPDLTLAPTNTLACQDGFPVQINPSFPQPFTLQGAQSCTLLSFFGGEQAGVPGTVVSANIRIGNVTGPMRFVRMRILFQNNNIGFDRACCSVEQFGQVFTPAANAVTTVALNFPMTRDPTPSPNDTTTLAAADLVGLEILAPNVPIPGNWTRNGGPQLGLPDYIYFPALSTRVNAPSSNLRSDGSYSGFLPSFNLNFVRR
ncbi:MAG: hypothetical protein IVW51_16225 [Thermaceae bacterium]|nr:hypothetical protein [Thermaceae bacterium]